MRRHLEFLRVFLQYARFHKLSVAARIARDIAYLGASF